MMIRKVLAVFLLVLFISACGKERNNIPNIAVNYSALLTTPALIKLNSPGGAVIISGHGVAGLIIYRTLGGNYVAYDRCSTVNPEKVCPLDLDDPTFTVTDKCSGGKFSLEDGSPVKAPAELSLKKYTVITTNNTIQVRN